MRGVPRERLAISSAPSWSQSIFRIWAERSHDHRQLLRRVQLQPEADAEAVAQGRGEHARARGGPDQGELGQVQPDRARGRALADHDVQGVVLHRGVEHLLHLMAEAVDLVDEQHVARVQVREDGGQIARPLDGRAAGDADVVAHLRGDDARQRGLAQAGRAVEQDVVQRLVPGDGGLHVDRQALLQLVLAEVLRQGMGAQRKLRVVLFLAVAGGDDPFLVVHGSPSL